MSAQSDLYDAQLRHHISVQRLAAGNVKKVNTVLGKADRELTKLVNERAVVGDFTSERYKALLADVRDLRVATLKDIAAVNREDMRMLARTEQDAAQAMLSSVIPVRLDFAVADVSRLNALVTQHPFAAGTNQARTLDQWWSGLATADASRITSALQMGLIQSETVAQMARRVMDATDMTKRNAEAVVRTATNHVSNRAREEFFKENKDIITALMWVSTIDGRTTVICMDYDGHYAPLDSDSWDGVPMPHLETPYTRPPAHVQCRSYMVAVLSANGIAQRMPDRPYVRDARTREVRERDFRAEAKAKAGANWKGMSDKQRTAAVRDIRQAWARENIGTMPGKVTYSEWLKTQPASFQDKVLGKGRADLFRGGMTLDKFVDRKGGELTLKQLRVEAGLPVPKTPPPPPPPPTIPKWTDDKQRAWELGLTSQQRIAFQEFTAEQSALIRAVESGNMSGYSFSQEEIKWARGAIDHMYAGMRTAPVYNEGPIYRGLAISQKELAALQSSESFTLNAMSSASIDESTALGFMREAEGDIGVLLKFKETNKGVRIDGISANPTEREVLLPRGAAYRIVSMEFKKGTHRDWWEAVVEEIN